MEIRASKKINQERLLGEFLGAFPDLKPEKLYFIKPSDFRSENDLLIRIDAPISQALIQKIIDKHLPEGNQVEETKVAAASFEQGFAVLMNINKGLIETAITALKGQVEANINQQVKVGEANVLAAVAATKAELQRQSEAMRIEMTSIQERLAKSDQVREKLRVLLSREGGIFTG